MSKPQTFSIHGTTSGTVQVLHLAGIFDGAAAPAFAERLAGLPGGFANAVVLDLSDLRYAGSAGIGAIVSLHRRLHAAGGTLVLAAPSEALAEILTTLNIGALIPVHDTVERAVLAALGV